MLYRPRKQTERAATDLFLRHDEGMLVMSVGLIIHAIVLTIVFLSGAYLVFATAQKSDGQLKSVGTILAAVLAAIGVLVLIGHLSAPMTGGRPFGIDMGPGAPAVSSSAPSASTSGPSASGGAKPAGEGSVSAGGPQSGDVDTGAAKP